MKLVVVCPTLSPDILSNPLLVARGLSELGHDVQILTSRARAPREAPYAAPREVRPPEAGGVAVRYIPHLFSFEDNVVTGPVGGYLDPEYDGVLLQEDFPAICQWAGRWAHRRRIPTTISFERYYHPDRRLVRTALSVLDHTLDRRLWSQARALTFHSHAALRFFTGLGAPLATSHYLPASIDADQVHRRAEEARARSDRPDRPLRILCVARLIRAKGLETLFRAMGSVRQALPDVRLTVLGRGPQEAVLRRWAQEGGWESALELRTAQVSPPEMPALYVAHDVYVQPSLVEPFGHAVVEAMACGLPVVASRVGGLADTVQDGGSGRLVDPGDPAGLAQALIGLLQDRDLRSRMGARGRERAREEFDYRKLAPRYVELLGERSGPGERPAGPERI